MPLDISGSYGILSDIAAAAGQFPSNYAVTGHEQLYSPILIVRGGQNRSGVVSSFEIPVGDSRSNGKYNSGHLGATRSELDPYFSTWLDGNPTTFITECDYQIVMNNGTGDSGSDMNIRKINRPSITQVSVSQHRGPMVLSGWGSDLGDRPVPYKGNDVFTMDPQYASNRGIWKSGPVAFQWDRDRKVWSMGHHMICGVAEQAIVAPSTPCSPTYFNIKVFRDTGTQSPPTNAIKWPKKRQEKCTITNRDPSLYQEYVKDLIWVVAARINYEWIPVWVGCPEKCAGECPPAPCATGDT
jgi:hypothetical protein